MDLARRSMMLSFIPPTTGKKNQMTNLFPQNRASRNPASTAALLPGDLWRRDVVRRLAKKYRINNSMAKVVADLVCTVEMRR